MPTPDLREHRWWRRSLWARLSSQFKSSQQLLYTPEQSDNLVFTMTGKCNRKLSKLNRVLQDAITWFDRWEYIKTMNYSVLVREDWINHDTGVHEIGASEMRVGNIRPIVRAIHSIQCPNWYASKFSIPDHFRPHAPSQDKWWYISFEWLQKKEQCNWHYIKLAKAN